jgi:hypothetical protein
MLLEISVLKILIVLEQAQLVLKEYVLRQMEPELPVELIKIATMDFSVTKLPSQLLSVLLS